MEIENGSEVDSMAIAEEPLRSTEARLVALDVRVRFLESGQREIRKSIEWNTRTTIATLLSVIGGITLIAVQHWK
jgi:hypothetical protein